jgi:glycolate oxidase
VSPRVQKLKKILGQSKVTTDPESLKIHSTDAWLIAHEPEVVVFATNTQDVARTMSFATRHRIPITVRGSGVGYVGGCVPLKGGIVLSLARMNRIKELNIEDGVAVVEPGVLTGDLQDAARARGFFYPPDPASLRESSLGGNLATNAGGPRCLKYGVTRHYALGLEVVLPTGKIIRAGGRTHKNKTGFDLVGLFVGSEGLLGTITEATLRLIPHPQARACLSAGFTHEKAGARAVQAILKAGHLPSALEISDAFTLKAVRNRFSDRKGGTGALNATILPKGDCHLLVELDGTRQSVRAEAQTISRLLRKLGANTIRVAETEEACEEIWELRREFSRSLKATGLLKLNEDITIPRSKLPDLFEFTKDLQKKHGIQIASFGHAGDGNIHVNIMVDTTSKRQMRISEVVLDQLFRTIIRWKGSITGEHGIGYAKKRWWPLAVSREVMDLHSQLKGITDPAGILNPGKFV